MRSDSVWLEVPLEVRALAWLERLRAMHTSVEELLHAISASAAAPPPDIVERWRALANAGQVAEALSSIITDYIDPRSAGVPSHARTKQVHLATLEADTIAAVVEAWTGGGAVGPPSGTD
jgi:hypothetical protein